MSDYLSDEEQLARMRTWWERYGNLLLIGLILALLIIVGWRWMAQNQKSQIEAASELYAEFSQAKQESRSELFEQLQSEYSNTSYFTFALLEMAKLALADTEAEKAKQYLEQAAAQAPDKLLADLANIRLAQVLQQLKQGDEALQTLSKIRGEGNRPRVAELKGDIHLSRGELELAHEAYEAGVKALSDGEQQPVLEMKAINTANSHGI